MTAEHHRVIVGLSGGVDSSVAALLLKEQGYAVEGLFMKNWDEDDGSECSAAEDLRDVEAVCDRLQIPFRAVNFSYEYWEHVFEHFLAEYRAGRTPNPDILCNREIKFKAFLDFALSQGGDAIATGHYAQLGHGGDTPSLLRGADPDKDQSYFLHAVAGEALAHSLFPVGHLRKSEVRALARRAGLPTHAKRDSTGICFIGERRFREFLQRFIPARPGPTRALDGKTIGEHQGVMYYTLGQRQGLGIGGRADASGEPWYVAGKSVADNTLWVVQGGDHPALFSTGLVATDLHWIGGRPPAATGTLTAKVRYRQADQSCRLALREGGARGHVHFDTPQRGVTPGQSVVFYQGDRCLGGGVIESLEGEAACWQSAGSQAVAMPAAMAGTR